MPAQSDPKLELRRELARRAAERVLGEAIRLESDRAFDADRLAALMLADVPRHTRRDDSRAAVETWWRVEIARLLRESASAIEADARRDGQDDLPEGWADGAFRTAEVDIHAAAASSVTKHFPVAFTAARLVAVDRQREHLDGAALPELGEVERSVSGEDAAIRDLLRARVRRRVPALLEETAADVEAIVDRAMKRAREEFAAHAAFVESADAEGVEEAPLGDALRRAYEAFAMGRLYGPFPLVRRRIPSRATQIAVERFLHDAPSAWSIGAAALRSGLEADLPAHVRFDRSLEIVTEAWEPELRRTAIARHAERAPEARRPAFAERLSALLAETSVLDRFRTAVDSAVTPALKDARAALGEEQWRTRFPELVAGSWRPVEDLIRRSRRGELREAFEAMVEWPSLCSADRDEAVRTTIEEVRERVVAAAGAAVMRARDELARQLVLVERRQPAYESLILSGVLTDADEAIARYEAEVVRAWTDERDPAARESLFDMTRERIVEIVMKLFSRRTVAPPAPASKRGEGEGPGTGGGGTGAEAERHDESGRIGGVDGVAGIEAAHVCRCEPTCACRVHARPAAAEPPTDDSSSFIPWLIAAIAIALLIARRRHRRAPGGAKP